MKEIAFLYWEKRFFDYFYEAFTYHYLWKKLNQKG